MLVDHSKPGQIHPGLQMVGHLVLTIEKAAQLSKTVLYILIVFLVIILLPDHHSTLSPVLGWW
jgi:hypothetical protein